MNKLSKRRIQHMLLLVCLSCVLIGVATLWPSGSVEAVCTTGTNVLANSLATTCWECMFPISLSGVTVFNLGEDFTEPAIGPGHAPFPPQLCGCVCLGPICIPGLPLGIWEPKNLVEAVHDPLCFPTLGVSLAGGFSYIGRGMATTQMDSELNYAFFHVHYFVFPLWAIVGIGMDILCLNPTGIADEIDLAYASEIDPLWDDDLISLILFPEALVLANPVALAACAADSVAAAVGFPIDPLFWCAGSFGFMYPPTGHVSGADGDLKPAALSMTRLLAKLARAGTEFWTSANGPLLCEDIPTALIVKSQYKFQLLWPIPNTGLPPPCCQPLGRTLMMWGLGKIVPAVGEDFVWLLWKRQNCCML
ncbi:MAG: TraU family protein [Nitrospira sp.]|jgi:conjugal transfer pilus assembly protein TraU|nr:hypothetical protein [Nitrospira sp. CR2.1]MBL8070529.1 TraU family protein [Nitrospira sp.]